MVPSQPLIAFPPRCTCHMTATIESPPVSRLFFPLRPVAVACDALQLLIVFTPETAAVARSRY